MKENREVEERNIVKMKKETIGKVKSKVDIFEKKIQERKLEDNEHENLVKIKENKNVKIKMLSAGDNSSPSSLRKKTFGSPITSKKMKPKNSRKLEGKLKTANQLNPIGEPVRYDGRFVTQKSIKDFWERKLDDRN